ncbi:MAG: hypothetical protein J2P20_15040, partial [Pseudonocardia sp.]|nr:hypothetical protein [Pseudonocardia sp.]
MAWHRAAQAWLDAKPRRRAVLVAVAALVVIGAFLLVGELGQDWGMAGLAGAAVGWKAEGGHLLAVDEDGEVVTDGRYAAVVAEVVGELRTAGVVERASAEEFALASALWRWSDAGVAFELAAGLNERLARRLAELGLSPVVLVDYADYYADDSADRVGRWVVADRALFVSRVSGLSVRTRVFAEGRVLARFADAGPAERAVWERVPAEPGVRAELATLAGAAPVVVGAEDARRLVDDAQGVSERVIELARARLESSERLSDREPQHRHYERLSRALAELDVAAAALAGLDPTDVPAGLWPTVLRAWYEALRGQGLDVRDRYLAQLGALLAERVEAGGLAASELAARSRVTEGIVLSAAQAHPHLRVRNPGQMVGSILVDAAHAGWHPVLVRGRLGLGLDGTDVAVVGAHLPPQPGAMGRRTPLREALDTLDTQLRRMGLGPGTLDLVPTVLAAGADSVTDLVTGADDSRVERFGQLQLVFCQGELVNLAPAGQGRVAVGEVDAVVGSLVGVRDDGDSGGRGVGVVIDAELVLVDADLVGRDPDTMTVDGRPVTVVIVRAGMAALVVPGLSRPAARMDRGTVDAGTGVAVVLDHGWGRIVSYGPVTPTRDGYLAVQVAHGLPVSGVLIGPDGRVGLHVSAAELTDHALPFAGPATVAEFGAYASGVREALPWLVNRLHDEHTGSRDTELSPAGLQRRLAELGIRLSVAGLASMLAALPGLAESAERA